MNGLVVILVIAGCGAYVACMSALGKFLARGTERCSAAFEFGPVNDRNDELQPDAREPIAS